MVFDQLGNYMVQSKDYEIYSENSKYYFNIINPAADTGISICYLKTSALEELTLESILALLDSEHQLVTAAEKDKWNKGVPEQGDGLWIFECGTSSTNIDK